jgi:DNA-binding MurR/RpiR family transcriptional regulator
MRDRAAGRAKVQEAAGPASVHARIRADYEALSPAERRVADVVLNFPGDLAGYTATELATISEVSNTAVSRFVRRLGFSNYDEMRRLARKEQEEGSPLYLLERRSAGPSTLIAERHVETVIGNLRRTFSGGTAETISALAAAIAGTSQVWICGFRHGRFLAGYLRWSLTHARGRVRMLPGDGETLGETMIDIEAGDVVVIFAIRRRVPAIAALLQAATALGARVALITDPGMVATGGAEWVVRCQTRTRGPIDDHAAAMAVAHVLTEQVIVQLQNKSSKRLGEIDDLHDRLDELE